MKRASVSLLLLSLSVGLSACAFPYTASTPALSGGVHLGEVSPWLHSMGYRSVPGRSGPYGPAVSTYRRATNHHEDQIDIMIGGYRTGCGAVDQLICHHFSYAVVEARTFAIEPGGRRHRVPESDEVRLHARTVATELTRTSRCPGPGVPNTPAARATTC